MSPYSYVKKKQERYFARKRCFCGRPASGLHRKIISGRAYLYYKHSGGRPQANLALPGSTEVSGGGWRSCEILGEAKV